MGVGQRIRIKEALMSGQTLRIALGLLAASMGLAPLAATAASTDKGAVTYRWVDEQGVVHYGDRIPPQYVQKESAILNSRGVEVRRTDAQKTPEQLAAEEHTREEVSRQKQHDSFLISTYTSVKDIESLRDVRLDQLRGQQIAAEQYVETLHSRLTALQTRARLFRPYSPKAEARRMPDDLAEDLVRTLKELNSQSGVLVTKGEEESSVKAQFQADIERYRELHTAHN
jgi:hypothetical protein